MINQIDPTTGPVEPGEVLVIPGARTGSGPYVVHRVNEAKRTVVLRRAGNGQVMHQAHAFDYIAKRIQEGTMSRAGREQPADEETTMGKKKKAAGAEPAKRDDLCVFAFRLTKADRDLIHKAAGPGKATQFVLAAALEAAGKAGA